MWQCASRSGHPQATSQRRAGQRGRAHVLRTRSESAPPRHCVLPSGGPGRPRPSDRWRLGGRSAATQRCAQRAWRQSGSGGECAWRSDAAAGAAHLALLDMRQHYCYTIATARLLLLLPQARLALTPALTPAVTPPGLQRGRSENQAPEHERSGRRAADEAAKHEAALGRALEAVHSGDMPSTVDVTTICAHLLECAPAAISDLATGAPHMRLRTMRNA